MGVKDSFVVSSVAVKIALVVALVSNICNWISFTTSSWFYTDYPKIYSLTNQYTGLWRRCASGDLGCEYLDGTADDALAAVQAFAIFGFISLNVGLVLLVLLIFLDRCKVNAEIRLASAILFFVSVVTWLISVIVFGAKVYKDRKNEYTELGFSFGLAIVSLILSLVSGIFVIIEGTSRGSVGNK